MKKKKQSIRLFLTIFVALSVLIVLQNLVLEKTVVLSVPDNDGVSWLETADNMLLAVFQDAQVVVWDWKTLSQPQEKGDFMAVSDRTIVLDSTHLAAVAKIGKKILTVYTLPSGQKAKELSVGWEDQEVWLRISSDKKTIALIRKDPVDSAGKVVYEFLTVDIEKELLGVPVSLSIQTESEDLIDYCIDENSVLYVIGAREKMGRIAAVDLVRGTILWDRTYDQTEEFCSVMALPKNECLLAGNRNGVLYKLNAKTGEIVQKIHLLEKGETRPITNDYSVLNLAFSLDGQYFVATINPKAYLLKTNSDEIIYTCTPANRLVSKIAFSPDTQFFATSDIRAGYPIKIWPMPETE